MKKLFFLVLMVLLAASASQATDLLDPNDGCLLGLVCDHDGDDPATAPVPEPGAALAFAGGLVALGAARRRARKG